MEASHNVYMSPFREVMQSSGFLKLKSKDFIEHLFYLPPKKDLKYQHMSK